MPTDEDPGLCCKFCCPPCAVYQVKGCECPDMILACWLGCWYTIFCWDSTSGNQVKVYAQ
jgi:hypothetical protein